MVLGQLGRGSGRGIEPFRKCWAGEGGVRSGQQGTRLIQRMVWVGRVGHTFDPHRITASSHEQPRHLDEVFLTRTGDLRDRFLRGSRKTLGSDSVARSTSASATVLAAMSCVRIFGT